jgi:hypothetical protein
MQHINYCSHAEQLSQKGGVAYHDTVVYFVIFRCVSFRDIRGHLGTIPSIVTFNICACHRRRLYQGHPSESRGIKIGPTCRRKRQKNMFSC